MGVMVQTIPQQTVTMVQTRPASANEIVPAQGQYGMGQQPRNNFYGTQNNSAPVLYRAATAPIQPYAFTATPTLNNTNNWQQPNTLRAATSTPSLNRIQNFDVNGANRNTRMTASPTTPSMPNNASSRYAGSRDDSSIPGQGVRRVAAAPRPQSAFLPGTMPALQLPHIPNLAAPSRPSPDRYRRSSGNNVPHHKPQAQSPAATGSGMAGASHLYALNSGAHSTSNTSLPDQSRSATPRTQPQTFDPRRNSYHDAMRTGLATDDIQLHRQVNEDAKRFRRRSMPTLNDVDLVLPPATQRPVQKPADSSPSPLQKPTIMHAKTGSSESVASVRSSSSRPSSNRRNVASPSTLSASITALPSLDFVDKTSEQLRLINIPPRVSSSDMPAAVTKPAEAAAPAVAAVASPVPPKTAPVPVQPESPAMRQLNMIKGGKLRSKTSKLRRAFSFGSAAELHKVPEDQATGASAASTQPGSQKAPLSQEEYDAEQARIAQKQEEGGIGSSIYAGAKIFSGSTDNLSISSTASSASIMIRKMGRGMKKSTRSLVGLFRPKSIIGAPSSDAARPDTSGTTAAASAAEATVSMVTVEAERERINVHPDLHAQAAGGTSFPHLERNSVDASKDMLSGSGSDTDIRTRAVFPDGDKEPSEVIATVRKGILKNTSGTSSPVRSPADMRTPPFEMHNPAAVLESPASSAPSTPNDDMQGHKRSGSVAIGSEDYFVSALRLRQENKSGNSTPQGSMKRSATFSPRLIFYDTWPSQEYDRRGEIATCNRLTPMLAQQIKEELNTFKMEMEVHETSKVYTHFF